MFGLFSSRSPLSTGQRVDLELLSRRALDVFGRDDFANQETLLSTDEIPGRDAPVQEQVGLITDFLAPRFRIAPSDIEFSVIARESNQNQQPYLYDNGQIALDEEVLTDRLRLVTTVSNALSHHRWEQFATRPLDRDPRTVMLLPILLGLGVLVADASLYDNAWSLGGWSGWSISRAGHYNAMEVGYVMALMSRIRDEPTSPWLSSLRLDGRATAKGAMKYFGALEKARQTQLFDAARIPSNSQDPREMARWLSGDSADWALASARTLATETFSHHSDSSWLAAALTALESKDPEVVAASAKLVGLAKGGSANDPTYQRILESLKKLSRLKNPAIAFAAMDSATRLGVPYQDFLAPAERLLRQESFDLLPVLAWIEEGAGQCEPLTPILRDLLVESVTMEMAVAAKAVFRCFSAVAKDWGGSLQERFRGEEALSAFLAELSALLDESSLD